MTGKLVGSFVQLPVRQSLTLESHGKRVRRSSRLRFNKLVNA